MNKLFEPNEKNLDSLKILTKKLVNDTLFSFFQYCCKDKSLSLEFFTKLQELSREYILTFKE